MKKLAAALAAVVSLSLAVTVGPACSSGPGGGAGGGSGGSTGGGTGGSTGGGTGGSTGGGTGGSTGGGTGGTGGGNPSTCPNVDPNGASCNTLVALGADVMTIVSNAPPPMPMGGTPMDGTYVLVTSTEHSDAGPGPNGERRNQTLAVTTGMLQQAEQRTLTDGGCEIRRTTGTLTFSGTNATFVPTCPICDGGTNCNMGGTVGFTASGTMFTIIQPENNGARIRVQTFNRR